VVTRPSVLLVAAAILVVPLHAERSPLRSYTVADGLAHDRVTEILADSRGFLWFSTTNGISRFDGSRFLNYGIQDGLPSSTINAVIELERSEYLIASNGDGVGRYSPERQPRVQMFPVSSETPANRVNVLMRGRNRLWAGTDGGLFAIVDNGATLTFEATPLDDLDGAGARVHVLALAEDPAGRLWIGTGRGLCIIAPSGVHNCDSIAGTPSPTPVRSLLSTPDGMWVGHDAGLSLMESTPPARGRGASVQSPIEKRRYRRADGLPHDRVNAVHRGADDTLWIGTMGGLARLDGTGVSSRGLPSMPIQDLTGDRHGNVWIAVVAGGVMRLAAHGLTTYTVDDGLASPFVQRVLETRAGELAVITRGRALSLFDERRFELVRPMPTRSDQRNDGYAQYAFVEDRDGGWWVSTGDGLARYPPVRDVRDLARTPPSAVYSSSDGLAGDDLRHLFADSRGDIWMAERSPRRDSLTRWDRATNTFRSYSDADGLPARNPVVAFAEDRAGHIWVGFWEGGAARFRGGTFERLPGINAPVVGWHVARDGGLWGATLGGGLVRVDDPAAAVISARALGLDDGLPSDRFTAIVDDNHGRLYLASPVGLIRLDLKTMAIRHYTQEDGLARTEVKSAFRARNGVLWFGTDAGVSRLVPDEPGPGEKVQLLIGGARINGAALPISDLGTASAGPFNLDSTQRHVEIDFLSLGTNRASGIEYQLVGAEREWTPAAGRRTVNYARLASGSYRFVVRAPNGEGWTEASMAFAIKPPLWQRAWFLVGAGVLLVGGLFVAHRTRVAHLTAVERVRTRIASDLHDDIGTNLSQIAILGELATRHRGDAQSSSLARIAELSRESVDSLGDIVWSIDPDKDHLGNLTMRMRRLASDLLSGRDIAFTFDVHGSPDLAIGAAVRRHVFLAFKESLHNVVRHADCKSVSIDVRTDRGQLSFMVADDGHGFDTATAGGHGLTSLRQRAERCGGTFTVTSTQTGTTVVMTVPRRPRHIPT
jgi:ligand-binding sensor domain-containing protein/two-component sensor histidine kinase